MLNTLKVYQLDKLSECLDYTKVDSVLDELDIEKSIEQRILVLYQHMGISQSFTSTHSDSGLPLEEEYAFARQQLVFMNEQRIEDENAIANSSV